MKLLLDENLSRRLVPFLQHDFPDTSQVVLLGMQSASDKEVWQKAKDDGYVIVTRDADFQELSLVWGQPHQVIRLKNPEPNPWRCAEDLAREQEIDFKRAAGSRPSIC